MEKIMSKTCVMVPMTGKKQAIIDDMTRPNVLHLGGPSVSEEVPTEADEETIVDAARMYAETHLIDTSDWVLGELEFMDDYSVTGQGNIGWKVYISVHDYNIHHGIDPYDYND